MAHLMEAEAAAVDSVITVTTVVYNSFSTLPAYAEGLIPALESGVVRLVVVDNASPDNSAALVETLFPEATLLRSPVNGGFAAGCNLAWPLVEGRYWLLLNPDVYADVEGIQTLIRWMDRHPRVAIASPAITQPNGELIPAAIPHDSLWRPMVELLRLHRLVPEPMKSELLLAGARRTPEAVRGWVTGAAMIVRVEAVQAVGLMDDTFFMYGEEREWCWRMARAGWSIGLCSEVRFAHEKGASANVTWGDDERIRREVVGHLRVSRKMRGDAFTRLLALCLGVSVWLGAVDPRRARRPGNRQRLRAARYITGALRLPSAADPD